MKTNLKTLLSIFSVFFRIGAFTFGGGYAMIPLIQKETVEKKKWITDDDILEIIAIAESTPGPIAINSATFVGYRVAGVLGALFGTVGMVLPSFTIILILFYILREFQQIQAVQFAFNGIRAGVLALILKALWNMYKKAPKGVIPYCIMAGAFVLTAILDLNVLYVIIACALTGLISSVIMARRVGK
jgi:chromate transporter